MLDLSLIIQRPMWFNPKPCFSKEHVTFAWWTYSQSFRLWMPARPCCKSQDPTVSRIYVPYHQLFEYIAQLAAGHQFSIHSFFHFKMLSLGVFTSSLQTLCRITFVFHESTLHFPHAHSVSEADMLVQRCTLTLHAKSRKTLFVHRIQLFMQADICFKLHLFWFSQYMLRRCCFRNVRLP